MLIILIYTYQEDILHFIIGLKLIERYLKVYHFAVISISTYEDKALEYL